MKTKINKGIKKIKNVHYRKNKKYKRHGKLQWSMVTMIIFGWLIPLLVISVGMNLTFRHRVKAQLNHTITTSFESAIEICKMRMDDVSNVSKSASYDNMIRDYWNEYTVTGDSVNLYKRMQSYLLQKYRYNSGIKATIVYFADESENLYYTYNEYVGGSYNSKSKFERKAKDDIEKLSAQIGTTTTLVNIEGNLYMVRNLVKSDFTTLAVLVNELNPKEIFHGLEGVWGYTDREIYVDGLPILHPNENKFPNIKFHSRDRSIQISYGDKDESAYVYKHEKNGGVTYTYVVDLDPGIIMSEIRNVNNLFVLIAAFSVPLIIFVFLFFRTRVTRPIEELLKGTREIRNGNYGLQIKQMGKNQEFYELTDEFNAMSMKLQKQFRKIYLEELAARDAKIMALQSQINPHFLNNTLEIINWEVRMAENYKVSAMIEALSTMLEATMNRKNQSLIPLAEELGYIDAYLFIISQRFGEQFQVIKNVDESLLRVEVPRLIIQPVVENAVEHGINLEKKSILIISIYKEGVYMCIEVKINKTMSRKDKENINNLLSDNYLQNKNVHNEHSDRLGIRNVDQRIKIIYGKECGLKVNSDSLGCTISKIMVKIDK